MNGWVRWLAGMSVNEWMIRVSGCMNRWMDE